MRRNILSFVMIISMIFSFMYLSSYVQIAYMQSLEYDEDAQLEGRGSLYSFPIKERNIFINGDVDVDFYRDGILEIQIIDDNVLYNLSRAFGGINEDGEKHFMVNAIFNSEVYMFANEDGVIHVSVQEETWGEGMTRIINYFDIPVKKDDELELILSKYTKEELKDRLNKPVKTEYVLKNLTNNSYINPTNKLIGEEAKNSRCYIEVNKDENNSQGLILGGGDREIGRYAKLIGVPSKGYWIEWYEDGKKMSEDIYYRVRADKDRTIVAKFVKDENRSKYDYYLKKYLEEENKLNKNKEVPFIDIDNHKAKEAISYLWKNNRIEGYFDNTFRPDVFPTRADLTKIILNARGLKPRKYKKLFTDVSSSDDYSNYLQTAVYYNFIDGYSDNSFRPKEKITRAQWLEILDKMWISFDVALADLKEENNIENILSIFKDKDEIPKDSRHAVARFVKLGIISSDIKIFKPNEPISRGEIAETMYKLLLLYE